MRKGSPIVLLAVLVACGSCVPGRTPSPSPSQPVAVATGAGPPDAAPSAATCNAGPNYCCERDGTILPVVCSPRPRGNETQRSRGPGGWCQGCYRRCLPPSARIATPGGERAVASLRVGELVWSVDAAGARVAAPIALVRSIPAPTEHRVLRIARGSGTHPKDVKEMLRHYNMSRKALKGIAGNRKMRKQLMKQLEASGMNLAE